MTRPWMPLYVGDYLSDTRRLSTLQHGIYMLLIMDYWSTGSLPDDDAQLAQIAGVTLEQWECNRNAIASFFLPGWKHKRIEEELAKAADVSSKRKANAEKRWSKCNANADANIMHRAPVPQSQLSSLRSDKSSQSSIARSASAENLGATAPADEPKSRHRKTRCQIAGDAQPDERQRADADEAGLKGDEFRTEWRRFRDYHRSKGSLMADWQAAWRTWLSNREGFRQRAGPKQPRRNPDLEAFEMLTRADHERNQQNQKSTAGRDAITALAIFGDSAGATSGTH